MTTLSYDPKKGINKIYKPSKKEQEVREHVYNRFIEMRDSQVRQSAEKEWRSGERAWEAIRRTDLEAWQSNYYVPLTTSVVESIISEITDKNTRPLILPRSQEDQAKALVMAHAFDYTWEVGDSDDVTDTITRSGIIRGTGIGQEMYLRDKRIVKDLEYLGRKNKSGKKNKKMKTKETEREVYEYDDCYLDYVSNWDFFWDEKANEINRGPKKAKDVVRRYVMDYNDAKNFFSGPIWNHLNNFQYVKPGQNSSYYNYYQPSVYAKNSDYGLNNKNDVEVLWYWARLPEDMMVVVVNDVVVRMGPNIYKHKWLPFAKAIDVKRLDSFCGKGEPALLESIQDEVNTMRQMVIDRNHLDIDKMFLISQNSMTNEEDLIARPHGAIPVDDPSKVKPVEYGDIPLSIERTFKSINEDSIRVTGVDDRFQSVSQTPSTATEAAILKESTLKRIKTKIKNLEKGFMVDIGRMRVANIVQFYSQPKLEKIVGTEGTTEYKRRVSDLMNRGLIENRDGKLYEKKYKDIRLEGKELDFNEEGGIIERKIDGFSFFELKPEFFVPTSSGGFDIKFDAGASLPVSKPLQQSKQLELMDRIIQIKQLDPESSYSLERSMDKVIDTYDDNPQDYKETEVVSQETIGQNRTDMAMQLAGRENQMVTQGKDIPPYGTPYAPPAHTMIHIEFLRSDAMKNAGDDIYKKLLIHTQGEVRAIEQRSGGQEMQQGSPGQPANQTPNPTGGGVGQGVQNVMPAAIQGGNQVPTGRALGNG